MKPRISLCIIAKNNASTLANCISSLKPIVREIILVDNGSSDDTKEIAGSFGAKVYDFEWKNNFSEAKNFAIGKACGNWIINLDADESISEKDLQKLANLVLQDEYVAYCLIQRNYTNQIGSFSWTSCADDEYKESRIARGFVPRKMVRLFKNHPRIKFEGTIHDSVIPSIQKMGGKICDSDIPIHHFGMLNRNPERTKWYAEIEKQHIKNDYFQEYQIASQLHSIGELDEALGHLQKSLKLNPNFYLSLLELAIIEIKKGKIMESKPLLIRSLQLNEHEMAWSHLGIVNVYEKNLNNAIKCFEKALSLNPRNADIHFNLAQALLENGDKEMAKKEFEKALYLNPDYKNKIPAL